MLLHIFMFICNTLHHYFESLKWKHFMNKYKNVSFFHKFPKNLHQFKPNFSFKLGYSLGFANLQDLVLKPKTWTLSPRLETLKHKVIRLSNLAVLHTLNSP
jgi:hypothetical protein